MAATAMARHHTRLSALLVQLSPVATDESLTLQLDSSLGELLQSTLVPSFVGAVVVCGEEVYRFTHGEATGATLFHMASVSKTFVAVAVMQLVQEGLLALDDAVLKYLPWWSINGERADEITVRQLLTHTAGMPDVVDYGWSRPEYDDDALERWLRGEVAERSLLWAPGSRGQSPSEGVRGSDGWAYSNIAFELLAALVAELRGVSFERAVAQQILAPLAFEGSTFLLSEAPASRRLQGYTKQPPKDGGLVIQAAHYPYNRRHAGSSTLNASLDDMTRWLAYFTSFDENDTLLSAAMVKEMWAEQRRMPSEGYMALGWFGGEFRGRHRMLYHSGADDGFVSKMVVLPDAQVGVVLMSNCEFAPMEQAEQLLLDVGVATADSTCCSGAGSVGDAVVHVELGCTNTVVNFRDGSVVSDFDLRLAVTAVESAHAHTLTVTTAGGESFALSREDAGSESGLNDPKQDLEVNRDFKIDTRGTTFELSVIACPQWERLGDGIYTLLLSDACGREIQTATIAFLETSGGALPWPANEGFTAPATNVPLVNPVTFEWNVDPTAQQSAVYFAPQLEGEQEGSSALEEAEREGTFGEDVRAGSFGPLNFPPGNLEIELAVTAVRSGRLDIPSATTFEITKGTVYSGEVTVV